MNRFEYGDFVEVIRDVDDKEGMLGKKGIVIGKSKITRTQDRYLLYIPYFEKGHCTPDYAIDRVYAYEAHKLLGDGMNLWFVNADCLTKIGEKPEDMSYDTLGEIIKSFDGFVDVIKEVCESLKDLFDGLDDSEENQNIHNHPIIKEFDEIFRKEFLGGKE